MKDSETEELRDLQQKQVREKSLAIYLVQRLLSALKQKKAAVAKG